MKNRGKCFNPIEAEAAAWLVRRDAGMKAEEEAEFEQWCAADPRHAAAVNEIDAVWSAFDRPVELGQAELLRARMRALRDLDRRRWMAASGALAAACLTVFLWLQHPPAHDPTTFVAATITARVTEPERRTLPDGSSVELRQGAEIAVAFDGRTRGVILRNGEAHFSVTKDPLRPFVVEAGAVKIRAVGTAFAVQLGRTEVEVLVTEGRVSVISPTPATPAALDSPRMSEPKTTDAVSAPIVEVGQRAIVRLASDGEIPAVLSVPEKELTERLSWRFPRLDFSEASIGEAAALFNRHNSVQIRVADDIVAALRVTGVFRSDNIDGFVRALESSLGVQAERRDREIALRSAQ